MEIIQFHGLNMQICPVNRAQPPWDDDDDGDDDDDQVEEEGKDEDEFEVSKRPIWHITGIAKKSLLLYRGMI
jgi:hypothetical protein